MCVWLHVSRSLWSRYIWIDRRNIIIIISITKSEWLSLIEHVGGILYRHHTDSAVHHTTDIIILFISTVAAIQCKKKSCILYPRKYSIIITKLKVITSENLILFCARYIKLNIKYHIIAREAHVPTCRILYFTCLRQIYRSKSIYGHQRILFTQWKGEQSWIFVALYYIINTY